MRGFCSGLGGAALARDGDLTPALPSAELLRVEGVELPESEVVLSRRVLIGIRDCEFRFDVLVEAGEEGGEKFAPYILDVGGNDGTPSKSLRVRRCMFVGRSGRIFSALISSNVGAAPRYHAVGEEDDTPGLCRSRSAGNIGLGLCILPSEPLRRRVSGMP